MPGEAAVVAVCDRSSASRERLGSWPWCVRGCRSLPAGKAVRHIYLLPLRFPAWQAIRGHSIARRSASGIPCVNSR